MKFNGVDQTPGSNGGNKKQRKHSNKDNPVKDFFLNIWIWFKETAWVQVVLVVVLVFAIVISIPLIVRAATAVKPDEDVALSYWKGKRKNVNEMFYDTEKVIRSVAKPVENPSSPEMKKLLEEMVQYLKDIRAGVGLAAPQIGIGERFFAVYVDIPGKGIIQYGLINPEVLSTSLRKCCLKYGEGCLSVAEDKEGYVPRYYKIKIKAFDALQGKEVIVTQTGYPAIILQHEFDHLNGILYYDHIDKIDPWKDDPTVQKIA
uniref:Peptide deformylase n=1 Tax=Junco hyemalis TaxID=40217 RepID=A0A8C5IJJ4_JUNHY